MKYLSYLICFYEDFLLNHIYHFQVKGAPLETSDRVRQLPEGSLLIAGVARDDAGDYTCFVENQFGTDTVTHKLTVHGML